MSVNTERPANKKHSPKIDMAENNPCLAEHKASLKCLDVHGYDKDMCQDKFANYQACVDFWQKIKNERKRNGIKPVLPPLEEREAIRKQHYGK